MGYLNTKTIIVSSLVFFFCSFIIAVKSEDTSNYLRVSAKKCQEYQEFYRETFAPRVPGREPIIGKIKCPRNRRVDPNMRREVFKHELPHTVSLWYDADTNANGTFDSFKFRCSGTLISKRFVLVSAHCIYSKWGKPTNVVLGDAQLFKENRDSRRQVVPVEDIIIHPNYVPPSSIDDIALIQLARTGAKYDVKDKNPRPSVRPACLPTENQEMSSGISLAAFDTSDGALRTEKVDMFASNKECEPLLKQSQNFTLRFGESLRLSQVCSKGLRSGTCMTDMGGALTTQTRGLACLHVVIGLMAVNSESCDYNENKPFAFTKVENYLDWIEGIVWPRSYKRIGLLRTGGLNKSKFANVYLDEEDYD